MVESKALENGLPKMGKTLEEAVTFHSVAAQSKTQRKPDTTVHKGQLPGTWYSQHNWDKALQEANKGFEALPEKVEESKK